MTCIQFTTINSLKLTVTCMDKHLKCNRKFADAETLKYVEYHSGFTSVLEDPIMVKNIIMYTIDMIFIH